MDQKNGSVEIDCGASTRFEQGRNLAIVDVWGEIDLACIPQFKSALDEALEADSAVIIDLAQVSYMDSSGFNTLLETSRVGKTIGVTVFLVNCSSTIERLLQVTRLDRMFAIAPDMEAARTSALALTIPEPAAVA